VAHGRKLRSLFLYMIWSNIDPAHGKRVRSLEQDMGLVRPAIHVLTGVIPVSEVANSLKTLSDGAKGVDGLSRADLRRASIDSLAAHCNLWLLTGHPPGAFKDGYTTLAPKVAQPTVSEHRPITVSTMIARLYHRLLAARLGKRCTTQSTSEGFPEGRWFEG
jgi:hypothetical protein